MKKLTSLIVCIICSICALVAQPNHSMNEFSNNDTLRLCQDNPIVIIQKDPEFSGTPYWITENGETHHADSIIITHENNGWLLYIERESQTYKNVYVMFQPLPEETTYEIWLGEDETQILKATPCKIHTFEYEWQANIWPENTVYSTYELAVSRPGIYECFVNDQCHTAVIITFIVNQSPSINCVTTNLQSETPQVYWNTYPDACYDSVAIYRNNILLGTRDFWAGNFNDLSFEGGQPQKYRIAAWKNGEIYNNSLSKWKRPIWFHMSGFTNEGYNYGWWPPTDENGTPIECIVRYYQLHEKLENGSFGLVRSMIPANEIELLGVENDYEKLILSAVLQDGRVIYSNVVIPDNYSKVEDNEEDGKDGNEIGYIYPNPTTGIINLPSNVNGEFRIFDLNGKIMLNGITEKSEINVSSLSAGMYTIVIYKNGKKTFVNKFIREGKTKQSKNRTNLCDFF